MEPVAIKALESPGYNLPAALPALLPSGLSLRVRVSLYLCVDSYCIRIRHVRPVYVRAVYVSALYVIYAVTSREAIMKYTMCVRVCASCVRVLCVCVCVFVCLCV